MTLIACSIAYLCLIGIIFYLLKSNKDDRKEWALERGALLQRIQAPEVAVISHAQNEESTPVQVISPLDDKTFNKIKAERGESD